MTKNKHTDKGPFLTEFEKDLEGVVLREMVTYRYKDGMMVKETVSRRFKKDGNYHDTTLSTPMPELIHYPKISALHPLLN